MRRRRKYVSADLRTFLYFVLSNPRIVIHGTGALRGGTVDPCNDHRIAMSAAVAACMCTEWVTVLDAQCVQKSYHSFWGELF